jgi:hypothetical protein
MGLTVLLRCGAAGAVESKSNSGRNGMVGRSPDA